MVRITADSTADLGRYFTERDIPMMPLVVTLGEKSFRDGVDITPQDIFDFVAENKILPKTAARSVEDFKSFFLQFREKGEEVVHLNISSGFSSSYEYASLAAREVGGVFVIDSRSLSSGTGLLALYAKELAERGLGAREIFDKVSARVNAVQASFVVDTMEYLKKGGRCSGVTALAASVLKIKPTILVKDGGMVVGKKYMGSFDKIVPKYVEDTLLAFPTPDYARVFITHTYAPEKTVEAVRKQLEKTTRFREIIETKAGSTVTSHCGKSTLGILYLNDGGTNAD